MSIAQRKQHWIYIPSRVQEETSRTHVYLPFLCLRYSTSSLVSRINVALNHGLEITPCLVCSLFTYLQEWIAKRWTRRKFDHWQKISLSWIQMNDFPALCILVSFSLFLSFSSSISPYNFLFPAASGAPSNSMLNCSLKTRRAQIYETFNPNKREQRILLCY